MLASLRTANQNRRPQTQRAAAQQKRSSARRDEQFIAKARQLAITPLPAAHIVGRFPAA